MNKINIKCYRHNNNKVSKDCIQIDEAVSNISVYKCTEKQPNVYIVCLNYEQQLT